ncbi:general secretion pathway protein GspB [Vogesella sp. LIG4]|uniref:general secretion pathway protein GspB n=1 Tax=Vogesella sp. LIG4 TaxID=1192162 RepID=UPI00081FFB73|nr:general secretion pathway protein GspB [Vogesella sp. LIG4]SCK24868.1 general secretion pathway protein B [Vogesella sp. LIG4]
MSYILDALLKADRERQQQSAPSLYTSHVATMARPARPLRRWGVLAGVTALGLLAAGGLLYRPTRPAPPPPAARVAIAPAIPPVIPKAATAPAIPKPATTVPPETHDAIARAPAAAPPADSRTAPAPAAAPRAATAAPVVALAGDKNRQPPPPAAPAPSTTPRAATPVEAAASDKTRPAPAAVATAQATTARPAANVAANSTPIPSGIVDFGSLPPALRREVESSVVISGLSLTPEDGEQVAIINDRVLHAGDEVLAGMILESVRPDGLVLRYKGYRFRRGLN